MSEIWPEIGAAHFGPGLSSAAMCTLFHGRKNMGLGRTGARWHAHVNDCQPCLFRPLLKGGWVPMAGPGMG